MKLSHLRIENYLTYDKAYLDLSKIRKALIVGIYYGNDSDSNGSGKSNLLRSIPWCIWGENPESPTIDMNVKDGADSCLVEVGFTHDGKQVKIIRVRNKKKSMTTVDFIIDDVVSNGSSVKDTNAKIIEFLNLDYDAYINSVYIRQDDVYSLANTKNNNEGRELLERVLGLDQYDLYHDEAKRIVKDLETDKSRATLYLEEHAEIDTEISTNAAAIEASQNELLKAEREVKTLDSQMSEKRAAFDEVKDRAAKQENLSNQIRDEEGRLSSLNSELENLTQQANTFKASIEERIERLKLKISSESEIRASYEDFQKSVKEDNEISEVIKALTSGIDQKEAELSKKEGDLRSVVSSMDSHKNKVFELNDEKKSIQERIENPSVNKGERCSQCLTSIDDHSMESIVKHLQEKILDVDKKISDNKSSAKELIPKRDAIQKEVADIKAEVDAKKIEKEQLLKKLLPWGYADKQETEYQLKFKEVEENKAALAKAESGEELEGWKKTVKSKRDEIGVKTSFLGDLKLQYERIEKVDFTEVENTRLELSILGSQIDSAKQTVHIKHAEMKAFNDKAKEFDTIKERVKEEREKIEEISKSILHYNELVFAFSSRGIRSHILETAIEEVEREANEILPRISSGRLSINFKTKKEVKKSTKGISEKLVFEVVVNDGEKTFPFSMYSGGEKFRISFVIRVALSKLLLRRANSKLEFLIIDEAISPLDTGGIEKMIQAINQLQEDFGTILVITHRTDVKKYFDQIITVHRDEKGSTLEIGI